MKKILIILCAVFICGAAIAQTIRWHIGDTVYQTTTCNAGESITPPTAPDRFGYTFIRYDAYTPIEYLESTGTQWIDTGVPGKNGIKTEMQLRIKNSIAGCALGVGSMSSQFYPTFWYEGRWDSVVGSDILSSNVSANILYATKFESGVWGYRFYVNGILTNYGNNVLSLGKMFMFARPGGSFPMTGVIYYTKIYQDDILVRDFIPVLDSNGTPCMYDKVENKFYYNAGTGQFIAGPVIGE